MSDDSRTQPTTTPRVRDEPPDPPNDVDELCRDARLGAAVIGGWGDNPNVHEAVAYSCRAASKFITALVDAIRVLQKDAVNGD